MGQATERRLHAFRLNSRLKMYLLYFTCIATSPRPKVPILTQHID